MILIQDESKQRVTHFLSHKDIDFVQMFNQKFKRDFYSNNHYERVGGIIDEMDSEWLDVDYDSIRMHVSEDDL